MHRNRTNRKLEDIRPTRIDVNVNRYAEGSVLIHSGNTQVLCTASIEDKVPDWLRGKGQGWITAEYSMLPRATHTRSKRDREKVSGRTQEIQRLIGRSLRSIVDLKAIGERSIVVDCDVLQADGGTRTASINGGCVALGLALRSIAPIRDTVSAISIGLDQGVVLTDLDYDEDSSIGVDMNFVISGSGNLIEVQGTAERGHFSRIELNAMTDAAYHACGEIQRIQKRALGL